MRHFFSRVIVPNKGRGLISTQFIQKGQLIHSEYPLALQRISQTVCSNCLSRIDRSDEKSCCANAQFCSATCKSDFYRLNHRILCGRDESIVMGNFPKLVDQIIARIFSSMILEDPQDLSKYGDNQTNKLVASISDLCFIESWDEPQLKSIERNYENLISWLNSSQRIAYPGGLENLISWKFYERAYSVCHLNTFGIHLSNEHVMDAVALFREASMFNHSCVPNVLFKWNSAKPAGEFYALQDIPQGNELLVSYIDQFATKADRLKFLKGSYGFDCDCPKCLSES
jgi:hypothetical protein